ncbi:YlxP-like protein [Geomicrobium sp. JCM 19037]|uniref:DUF503 domain-containing protein n=1 Tax=unclassified Geomicrobium TaxID=2628951 RepID=UPI00045F1F1B|nr:DUF503 domain-containing protein [Geomicrobium sp. JCM 19037]GAK02015.1 YlxP-like protein [Geomicrobium sp. JCM 19037]
MIGALHVTCSLPSSHSLKEKRAVLQSILTRVRKRNLSISEMDHQDAWQRTSLSAVCISSDRKVIERELQSVLDLIDQSEGIDCYDMEYEWL